MHSPPSSIARGELRNPPPTAAYLEAKGSSCIFFQLWKAKPLHRDRDLPPVLAGLHLGLFYTSDPFPASPQRTEVYEGLSMFLDNMPMSANMPWTNREELLHMLPAQRHQAGHTWNLEAELNGLGSCPLGSLLLSTPAGD